MASRTRGGAPLMSYKEWMSESRPRRGTPFPDIKGVLPSQARRLVHAWIRKREDELGLRDANFFALLSEVPEDDEYGRSLVREHFRA